jgi:hypothetical protein
MPPHRYCVCARDGLEVRGTGHRPRHQIRDYATDGKESFGDRVGGAHCERSQLNDNLADRWAVFSSAVSGVRVISVASLPTHQGIDVCCVSTLHVVNK